MSHKPRKGYFVRGEFVAAGSERDLELQALERGDAPSRTELKQEADALQRLGVALIALRADALERLGLPDALLLALREARRLSDHGARRRQLQFIGKLMRRLPADLLDAARAALDQQQRGSAAETAALHAAEDWRERLLGDDAALSIWLREHPSSDAQALRALIRQARKDAQPSPAGLAARHGRAYRELYAHLRDTLAQPLGPGDTTPTPFNLQHEAS